MSTSRYEIEPECNLSGCLLVASPNWADSRFNQTVCLLVHHSSQGAVGVILNRALPFDAKLLWKAIGEKDVHAESEKLHLGGPNSGPVVAMHQREDLAEFVSGEGVYFAARADHLKSLIADGKRDWKIFVGQANWEAGSLDQQFANGCWLPIAVDRRIVFADVELVWPLAVRQAGNRLIQSLTGIKVVPPNPSLN